MRNQIVADGPQRLFAGQQAKRQKESGELAGQASTKPGFWKNFWQRYKITFTGRHHTEPKQPSPKSLW